jgi:hypothetical protein
MIKQLLPLLCLPFLFINCKTGSILQEQQTKTTQQVTLGSIGTGKDVIWQSGFNSSALPTYQQPIKTTVINKIFNNQTHKAFTKAKALQSADVNIQYVDSIPNKPHYLQLQIADKVEVLNTLNMEENSRVRDYLGRNAQAKVLSSIWIAFNKTDFDAILSADAVFLIENGAKTYALQLKKDNKKVGVIPFNQGIIFGYDTSNCCWQERKRNQIEVVDLVGDFKSCPNGTYRSARRADKSIQDYKF